MCVHRIINNYWREDVLQFGAFEVFKAYVIRMPEALQ